MNKYKIYSHFYNFIISILFLFLFATFFTIITQMYISIASPESISEIFALLGALDNDLFLKLLMLNNNDLFFKLLIPFGVILSAALASISMIKNINNTNKLEFEKNEVEFKNNQKYLDYLRSSFIDEMKDLECILDDSMKFIKDELKFDEDLSGRKNSIIFLDSVFAKSFFINFESYHSSFILIREKLNDKSLVYNYHNSKDIFIFEKVIQRQIKANEEFLNTYNNLCKKEDKLMDHEVHLFTNTTLNFYKASLSMNKTGLPNLNSKL